MIAHNLHTAGRRSPFRGLFLIAFANHKGLGENAGNRACKVTMGIVVIKTALCGGKNMTAGSEESS